MDIYSHKRCLETTLRCIKTICLHCILQENIATFCLVFCSTFSFSFKDFSSETSVSKRTVSSSSLTAGFSFPSVFFFSLIIPCTILAHRGRVFRILRRDSVHSSLDIAGWRSLNRNWHLSRAGEQTSSYEREDSCRAFKETAIANYKMAFCLIQASRDPLYIANIACNLIGSGSYQVNSF